MFFFQENTWKFSKKLNTDTFLQNAFQTLLLLMQSLNDQNLSFFCKKMTFFGEKILERLQEHYLAFFIEIACQTFILLRNFRNNQIFGFFLEKQILLLKRSFFSKIGKSGIFLLACVSKSIIIAQESWKRSTAGDFRESRWLVWKNCLYVSEIADIGNISIDCVSNGFFAWNFSKISNFGFSWKNRWWNVRKMKPEFFLKPISLAGLLYNPLKLCFYSRNLKTLRI